MFGCFFFIRSTSFEKKSFAFTLVREVTLSDKLKSEELSFLALVQNISKASHTDFVTGIVNVKI